MRRGYKILAIIGNGFDINMGIKSKYSDFFESLLKKHKSLKSYIDKGDIDKSDFDKISCWPYIFLNNRSKTSNWQNIEHNLFNFFNVQEQKKNDSMFSSEEILNLDLCVFKELSLFYYKSKRNNFSINSMSTKRLVKQILEHTGLLKDTLSIDTMSSEIDKMLFSQLKIFEKSFAKYMKSIIKNENNYRLKSQEFLKNLITNKDEKELYSIKKVDILNFNYTSILEKTEEPLENFTDEICFSERNIHGRLWTSGREECQIIFGIDSKSIDTESFIYSYTKTYRVTNNNIRVNYMDNSLKIENDYDYIYFYGHSLGQQDHSYFLSIFDIVNLYNGKTILRFLYTPYHKKKEENIKLQLETNSDISRLMDEYGKSFEQEKIKGKNLMHRLILEKRLEIIKFNK